jgi:hypothetical protein
MQKNASCMANADGTWKRPLIRLRFSIYHFPFTIQAGIFSAAW